MVFIIIWKVAGEFVSPKNMTIGSKSPSGVRKAAFHLSPSLIWILLYPHQMLNFMNREHPVSLSTTDEMSRDTLQFFLVHLFSSQ